MSHPSLSSAFPLHVLSKVDFKGVEMSVVYGDDNSHGLILGMAKTDGEALDKAEHTVTTLGISAW